MLSTDGFTIGGPILYGSALITTVLIVKKLITPSRQLPLPPGPKGLPVLGNISDLPPPGVPEWQHWIKHKDLYGPISSITVLGQSIILIHDLDIAEELLVKRSNIYSSRPHMFFAAEMCGFGHILTFQDYNNNLKRQRKLAAWQIGSNAAIKRFHSLIDIQVRRFLYHTLNNPDKYVSNLHKKSSSIALDLLYGYIPNREGFDPLIDLIDRMMSAFSDSTAAGVWMVDKIPWLRHFPEWLPGMKFKSIARDYHKINMDVTNVPFEFAARQRARGENKTSFVSGLLDKSDRVTDVNERADEEALIKAGAISIYGGGSDTTVAALSFYFQCMMLYPEVQKKAQEEVDRVCPGRLPTFADRPNLPYVDALLKENLRFNPIVPCGFPHTTDADDEYAGYRIPKGSIIVPSIRWIGRDPKIYTEPDLFNPERFLGPNPELSPKKFVFGFGKRICPGKQLADASMFLTIAQTLAVFDVKKPIDPITGQEIDPVMGSTAGTVSHPTPFKCSFIPRSEKCREMVTSIEQEHPYGESDAKILDDLLDH